MMTVPAKLSLLLWFLLLLFLLSFSYYTQGSELKKVIFKKYHDDSPKSVHKKSAKLIFNKLVYLIQRTGQTCELVAYPSWDSYRQIFTRNNCHSFEEVASSDVLKLQLSNGKYEYYILNQDTFQLDVLVAGTDKEYHEGVIVDAKTVILVSTIGLTYFQRNDLTANEDQPLFKKAEYQVDVPYFKPLLKKLKWKNADDAKETRYHFFLASYLYFLNLETGDFGKSFPESNPYEIFAQIVVTDSQRLYALSREGLLYLLDATTLSLQPVIQIPELFTDVFYSKFVRPNFLQFLIADTLISYNITNNQTSIFNIPGVKEITPLERPAGAATGSNSYNHDVENTPAALYTTVGYLLSNPFSKLMTFVNGTSALHDIQSYQEIVEVKYLPNLHPEIAMVSVLLKPQSRLLSLNITSYQENIIMYTDAEASPAFTDNSYFLITPENTYGVVNTMNAQWANFSLVRDELTTCYECALFHESSYWCYVENQCISPVSQTCLVQNFIDFTGGNFSVEQSCTQHSQWYNCNGYSPKKAKTIVNALPFEHFLPGGRQTTAFRLFKRDKTTQQLQVLEYPVQYKMINFTLLRTFPYLSIISSDNSVNSNEYILSVVNRGLDNQCSFDALDITLTHQDAFLKDFGTYLGIILLAVALVLLFFIALIAAKCYCWNESNKQVSYYKAVQLTKAAIQKQLEMADDSSNSITAPEASEQQLSKRSRYESIYDRHSSTDHSIALLSNYGNNNSTSSAAQSVEIETPTSLGSPASSSSQPLHPAEAPVVDKKPDEETFRIYFRGIFNKSMFLEMLLSVFIASDTAVAKKVGYESYYYFKFLAAMIVVNALLAAGSWVLIPIYSVYGSSQSSPFGTLFKDMTIVTLGSQPWGIWVVGFSFAIAATLICVPLVQALLKYLYLHLPHNSEDHFTKLCTVRITNLSSYVSNYAFKQHFIQQYGKDNIADAFIAYSHGELKKLVDERNTLVTELNYHLEQRAKMKGDYVIYKARTTWWHIWTKKFDVIAYYEEQLVHVDSLIYEASKNKGLGSGNGFVVFKTPIHALSCISSYSSSSWKHKNTTKFADCTKWKAERAPVAQDVIWEHLQVSTTDRNWRILGTNALFFSFFAIACAVGVADVILGNLQSGIDICSRFSIEDENGFVCKYIIKSIPSAFLTSITSILNVFIGPIIGYIAVSESHSSKGAQTASSIKNSLFLMYLNTIVMPVLGTSFLFSPLNFYPFNRYPMFNILSKKLIFVLLGQIFMGKAIEILTQIILPMFISLIRNGGKMDRPHFNYDGRICLVTTITLLSFYTFTSFPVIAPLALLFVFVSYFVDRWTIMYVSAKSTRSRADGSHLGQVLTNFMFYILLFPIYFVLFNYSYLRYGEQLPKESEQKLWTIEPLKALFASFTSSSPRSLTLILLVTALCVAVLIMLLIYLIISNRYSLRVLTKAIAAQIEKRKLQQQSSHSELKDQLIFTPSAEGGDTSHNDGLSTTAASSSSSSSTDYQQFSEQKITKASKRFKDPFWGSKLDE